MKSKLKSIIKYLIIFIFLIFMYVTILSLSALIPRNLIKDNIRESSDLLNEETNVAKVYLLDKKMYLDNFSNALMLNSIYSQDVNSPLESALLVRKNYLPGITQIIYEDPECGLKSASKYDSLNQVGELKDTLDENITESFEYARYWHGYIVIFKLIFLFLNLEQIRYFSVILISLLILVLLYLINKKTRLSFAIGTLIAFIFFDFFILGVELHGQLIIYITLLTSIYITLTYKEGINYLKLFFIVGSLTNFVDLLSVPILTLYIPLIFYFEILINNEKLTAKEIIKMIFMNSLMWFLGYTFTWIMKWVLVDIIFDRNVISNSITQIKFRGYSEKISYLDTIIFNIVKAGKISFFVTIILIVLNIIALIKSLIQKNKTNINYNLFFYIVSIMPFVWYAFTESHANDHSYFTYKNLLIITLSQLFLFINNYSKLIKNKNV